MTKTGFILLVWTCLVLGLAAASTTQSPQAPRKTPQSAQPPDDKAKAEARLALELAQMYLDLGDLEAAKTHLKDALKSADGQGVTEATKNQINKDVQSQLEKLNKPKQAAADKAKKKHLLQLQQAEDLFSKGKADEASKIAQQVLGESDDPDVVKKAQEVVQKIGSTWRVFFNTVQQHLLTGLGWMVDIIIGGLILYVVYSLLRQGQNWSAKQDGTRWKVNPIEDTSNLGVAGAVVEALNRWKEEPPAASSGLLRLGIVRISTKPELESPDMELDLTPALEDLKLNIGTVSIGGIAKAAATIRRWFAAKRPSISGSAVLSGDQVVVSLTRRDASGIRNTVTASAKKEQSIDAAEAASFKMYYLIGNRTTVARAEAANKLRLGLNLLGEYISKRNFDKLEAAYGAFRDILIEDPTFVEARLYEAVALDLLERHDEAIRRFHYLAQPENTPDEYEWLRQKACYNEAVSRFRKYDPDELQEAIKTFDSLVGPEPSVQLLADSPIKALSYAAKANAIAHKPLFWQGRNPEYQDEQVILQRKTESQQEVNGWIAEVEEMTKELEQVYAAAANRKEVWDDITRRQLKWAIENARGNIYLNYAKGFLRPPYLPGESQERRQKFFERAYEAFQNCELLLPPGVETLTNLATVLSGLSRNAEARRSLELAIKLNPQYEYAYYRLAQSWDEENRTEKVVEWLKNFAKLKTPTIKGFKDLYSKYATELARP